jgi:acyl carrier protein
MDELGEKIRRMTATCLYLEVEPQMIDENANLLTTYNLDPMMLVGITTGLNEWFGIQVSDSEREKEQFTTVRGIADFVRAKIEANERRRPIVLAQIVKAFANVTREDGVSLHEADVIDDYGTTSERSAARALDTENSWQGIPDSNIAHYYWILSFLDSKGFRYYIAAYMAWTIRNFDMTDSTSASSTVFALCLSKEPQLKQWALERFNALNAEQSKAVARFLEYMSHTCYHKSAREALDNYWSRFEGVG